MKIIAYLKLTRPANIVTALADILAGFSVSIALQNKPLLESLLDPNLGWLLFSTIGLYGGGVVFNDVFDVELDKIERPERPIPSGVVSKANAAILGGSLLFIGIFAAYQVNELSLILAVLVAISALVYDAWGKHQHYFGPINMGLCRGGNLLLGISVFPIAVHGFWYLAFIPIVYIAAITMISRGEVHGKNLKALKGGMALYIIVIFAILALSFTPFFDAILCIPFLALFAFLIFPPLFKAIKLQEPPLIGKAVKAGVLSLIVMNASIAAGFSGWEIGALILILLPISIFIAKAFAVT